MDLETRYTCHYYDDLLRRRRRQHVWAKVGAVALVVATVAVIGFYSAASAVG